MQIHQGRTLRMPDMTATFDLPRTPSCQYNRQVRRQMKIRVAQPSAVHDHRVIQQRAFAIRSRLQPLEQKREHFGIEGVHFESLCNLFQVTGMVRQWMVRIGYTNIWIALVGLLVSRSEEHTSELQSRLHL